MEEKKMLGDFIYTLRKEKGLTQEALAEKLGVSNKAVSKWETYEANPELGLIAPLAAELGVTADELLAGQRKSPDTAEEEKPCPSGACPYRGDGTEVYKREYAGSCLGVAGTVKRNKFKYEFVSDKRTKKGKPYLHVNIGIENGRVCRANGVVAVGLLARGIFSMGLVSVGLVSFGLLAVGLVAMGALSFGLLTAFGAVAVGLGVSAGAVAVGTLAVGAIAVGAYSIGAIAVGVVAHTSGTGIAVGLKTFIH